MAPEFQGSIVEKDPVEEFKDISMNTEHETFYVFWNSEYKDLPSKYLIHWRCKRTEMSKRDENLKRKFNTTETILICMFIKWIFELEWALKQEKENQYS